MAGVTQRLFVSIIRRALHSEDWPPCRLVGVGATLTTAFACILFFTQIVMDGLNRSQAVKHSTHNFYDFFLSFGTLLFAFGGASTFPTIQNDMEKKEKFSTSVIVAFISRCIFYFFWSRRNNLYVSF